MVHSRRAPAPSSARLVTAEGCSHSPTHAEIRAACVGFFLPGEISMIQVRMLKTFKTRYGFRRAGETLWIEDDYLKQLNRVGQMVEVIRDDDAPNRPAHEPTNRQAFAAAPLQAAVGKASESGSLPRPLSQNPSSEAVKDDGAEKPLPSLRAGRRSRKQTQTGAARDAK